MSDDALDLTPEQRRAWLAQRNMLRWKVTLALAARDESATLQLGETLALREVELDCEAQA